MDAAMLKQYKQYVDILPRVKEEYWGKQGVTGIGIGTPFRDGMFDDTTCCITFYVKKDIEHVPIPDILYGEYLTDVIEANFQLGG